MSSEQLKRITGKLQELVKNYDNLKKENERLRGELLPAKEREVGFLEQIGNLEQPVWLNWMIQIRRSWTKDFILISKK